jgi:Holliday junction resolvase-like predicted endonuclease
MIPRKGAEVAQITEKNMQDVLEVRKALEELSVQLACERITPEQVEEMKMAAEDFRFSHETSERHDRFDLYFIISGKIYRKLLHCICDVIFHIDASFPAFKHCRERNHPLPHTKWYFIICLYIQKADI